MRTGAFLGFVFGLAGLGGCANVAALLDCLAAPSAGRCDGGRDANDDATPDSGDPTGGNDTVNGDDAPGGDQPADVDPGNAPILCGGGQGFGEHSFGGMSLGIDEGLAAAINEFWLRTNRFCYRPDEADPARVVGVVRRSASSWRTTFRFGVVTCQSRVTIVDEVSDEVALSGTIERRADGCFVQLVSNPATYTPVARTNCPANPEIPETTAPAFPVTLRFEFAFLLPDGMPFEEMSATQFDPIEQVTIRVDHAAATGSTPCAPPAP